jgi:hypothetical protein
MAAADFRERHRVGGGGAGLGQLSNGVGADDGQEPDKCWSSGVGRGAFDDGTTGVPDVSAATAVPSTDPVAAGCGRPGGSTSPAASRRARRQGPPISRDPGVAARAVRRLPAGPRHRAGSRSPPARSAIVPVRVRSARRRHRPAGRRSAWSAASAHPSFRPCSSSVSAPCRIRAVAAAMSPPISAPMSSRTFGVLRNVARSRRSLRPACRPGRDPAGERPQ